LACSDGGENYLDVYALDVKLEREEKTMKTIVITGSSSGIGKATAKYFAQQGWKVVATMRKPQDETELNQIENISLYPLDVTDEASVVDASQQIIRDFGVVDVVLNNAGYAVAGAFEAATPEQIQSQFNTNVFGLMNLTRAFLPHFRANRAGLFLNAPSALGRGKRLNIFAGEFNP